MLVLYRLTLGLYWAIIRLVAPFNDKARKFRTGRKGWKRKLHADLQGVDDPVIWVHAASLGEFEQGRPIIEEIKKKRPEFKILLTFFSPSGYEIRKNYSQADWVHYFPTDSPRNARAFVEIVNPAVALFIKYEYWYCFLRELNRRSIPILLVSAIFRKNQLFFHPLGGFYRKALRWINHYFVQDESSDQLIRSIGISQSEITGDTRFDRVLTIAKEAKTFEKLDQFKGTETVMVLGSTWPSDMKWLLPFVREHQAELKFIIAPHNIDENEIATLEKELNHSIRFSSQEDPTEKRVMIVDNIGMLSSVYRYGEFAYVGGAFRGALHNTLEAAVYGIPVLIGHHPNNQKFKEAIELLDSGGAFSFNNTEELTERFEWLTDTSNYLKASQASGQYVRNRAGATEKVLRKIFELAP